MTEGVIRSRRHPLLQRLLALRRRPGREPDRLLVEGHRLLAEALAADVELLEVAATPRAAEEHAGLLASVAGRGVGVRLVSRELLQQISELDTGPGLVAMARRPAPAEPARWGRDPLLIVAAGVQNPGNLGALLRTAEAAGADAALLGSGCADPFGWKSVRGAMGSAFRLPIARFTDDAALAQSLADAGVLLVAAEVDAGEPYDAVDLAGGVALALGGEGAGLPEAIRRAAQRRVHIPLRGRVESLNVAVAAGILLFEAARQRAASKRVTPPPPHGRARRRNRDSR